MGNILCRQVSIDSNPQANGQNSKVPQQIYKKFTKSSMRDLLVNGMIANASHYQIKLCISWNQHKLQDQFVARRMSTGAEIGLKNYAPEVGFQVGGEYKIQQNRKKYDKTARHAIQPHSIKKIQIKKYLLNSLTLSITVILENKKQKVLDEISVNCIEDLQWIILSDSTSSKMSKQQYEFINTNYIRGYYDPRNSCKHAKIQQINDNNVIGCFCCLKLKQLSIGLNKWHTCSTCQKIYCQKCYQVRKNKKINKLLNNSNEKTLKLQRSFGVISRIGCLSQRNYDQELENNNIIQIGNSLLSSQDNFKQQCLVKKQAIISTISRKSGNKLHDYQSLSER